VLCISASSCQTLVSQSASIAGFNATEVNGTASIQVTADASVDPMHGVFRADASYSSATPLAFRQFQSAGSINDSFTISATGLNGQPGSLDLIFSANGANSAAGSGVIFAALLDGGGQTSACPTTQGCFFQGNKTIDTGG